MTYHDYHVGVDGEYHYGPDDSAECDECEEALPLAFITYRCPSTNQLMTVGPLDYRICPLIEEPGPLNEEYHISILKCLCGSTHELRCEE